MAVIDGQSYLDIANYYANAVNATSVVTQNLWAAVYEIVLLQEVYPEVDLLTAFYNGYQVNTSIQESRSTYLAPVRSLQTHVLLRSDPTVIQDVDDYILTYCVPVFGATQCIPEEFADLSAAAGYTIDSTYII